MELLVILLYLANYCGGYPECPQGEFWNITTGTCTFDCNHGYYEQGVCHCYPGWGISNSTCAAKKTYDVPQTQTDWMYFAVVSFVVIFVLYNTGTFCYYRWKSSVNSK